MYCSYPTNLYSAFGNAPKDAQHGIQMLALAFRIAHPNHDRSVFRTLVENALRAVGDLFAPVAGLSRSPTAEQCCWQVSLPLTRTHAGLDSRS